MVLYHGSQYRIEKPVFGGGRAANDYGRGFYCTESESLACEWAVSEKHDGYANCYEFKDNGLSILNLNGTGYTILHWLAVLLEHRTFDTRYGLSTLAKQYLTENFHVDVEAYDVIRGYRADDSYFSFAQDFISAKEAVREDWLDAKESRDSSARRGYFDMRKTPYRLEDISIQQIIQERIVPGDPRL